MVQIRACAVEAWITRDELQWFFCDSEGTSLASWLAGPPDGLFLFGLHAFFSRHNKAKRALLLHPAIQQRTLETPAIAQLEGRNHILRRILIQAVRADSQILGCLANIHDLTHFPGGATLDRQRFCAARKCQSG